MALVVVMFIDEAVKVEVPLADEKPSVSVVPYCVSVPE